MEETQFVNHVLDADDKKIIHQTRVNTFKNIVEKLAIPIVVKDRQTRAEAITEPVNVIMKIVKESINDRPIGKPQEFIKWLIHELKYGDYNIFAKGSVCLYDDVLGNLFEKLEFLLSTIDKSSLNTTSSQCRAGNITEANLPSELDTPEAKAIFDEARDIGLLDCDYKWLKTKQLLACFAQKMSDKLMLGKGVNSDGTSRISWQPFERLFNEKNLRLSYNDIQKTGQLPREHELIDKLFK
jgi:hypothetical protein